jgi:16S rRNA (guanine(966)-N(2))-methyltransferase RsmD
LRVVSGKCKGKKLFTFKGLSLRPTSDRVKESIFDILQKFPPGEKVLDLFAGTGALGIEALSRGARRAVFVEENARSGAALRKNIEACRLSDQSELIDREAQNGLKILEERGFFRPDLPGPSLREGVGLPDPAGALSEFSHCPGHPDRGRAFSG